MGVMMGVKKCDRAGCESVMCERYNPEYGYICEYCFEDLVDSKRPEDVDWFMTGGKTEYGPNYWSIFDSIFPRGNNETTS